MPKIKDGEYIKQIATLKEINHLIYNYFSTQNQNNFFLFNRIIDHHSIPLQWTVQ